MMAISMTLGIIMMAISMTQDNFDGNKYDT
jgi:hypothetical protein